MPVTKAKIEQLARALFPRYGIRDVASLVATIVKYRTNDGYAAIGRPEGTWSWFASRGATVVTPSRVVLAFPADYRRDAAQARADLHRQLEDASHSVMSEDEVESATRLTGRKAKATPPASPRTSAQLEREVVEALAAKPAGNLGRARAERLAGALRALGHEAEAFRQYNQWNAVGVHRVGPGTVGEWRQFILFRDDGEMIPPAGGRAYGTGNPWRYGPEHDAVEEAARWRG